MQVHRLIQSIHRNKECTELMREGLSTYLRNIEKFELPQLPPKEDRPEVIATMKALMEFDLVRLPYQKCYVEIASAPTHRIGLILVECETPKEFKYPRVDSIAKFANYAGRRIDVLFFMQTQYNPSDKAWANVHFLNTVNNFGCTWADDGLEYHFTTRDELLLISSFYEIAFFSLAWFLFMMCLKGHSKVKYAPPDKLNASRLKSRKEPIDAYTKVLLPGFRKRLEAGQATEGEDKEAASPRKRVRLHPRRGHGRDQRYGINNSLMKRIFIEPMMIGHEEEGRIYHLQYGQELTSEIMKEQDNEHPDNT